MFFLNLTAGEFLTLLGALGGLVAALYLLDRTKRKKIVSTLRFWVPAFTAEEQQSRKRMREPWSLVLQLLSLLLLLLAIAQLQWGSRERRGRDYVILLDTSSWAGERESQGTLLDREKALARRYLSALPPRDRVMLVRADALTTPVTPFTSDRALVLNAVNESRAEFSTLNIEQGLSFARQAQSWSGSRPGEIVYIGPRLIGESDRPVPAIPNLRTILVPSARENCGIRRIGVRRSDDDANSWQATVTFKNYGTHRRSIRLLTGFAGTSFAPRIYILNPGQEAAAEYNFSTNRAGRLISEIRPGDNLSSDDQASLELPGTGLLSVAVYTDRPEILRPLLDPNHRLAVKFFPRSAYTPKPAADVMLLDRFAPGQEPEISSLWIQPPKDGSPLPVKAVVTGASIKAWHSDTALGAGLHAREARISEADVFQTFEGDVTVGSFAEGPVVVVRPSTARRPKTAVIGFDPLNGDLKFEVTTPLLFANILRWLSPEAFQTSEVIAERVGSASIPLDPGDHAEHTRVTDDKGFAVPFTIRDRTLQLFVSHPSIVRIVSDNYERVLSLTIPDVAQFEWKPEANAATGVPAVYRFAPTAIDLWQWLAVLAGVFLFIEWTLFGRRRIVNRRSAAARNRPQSVPQRERELVSK